MTSRLHRSFSKLAAAGLVAAACALGGCGRKAGLDLPPGAPPQAKNQAQPDYGTVPSSSSASAAGAEVYRPPGSGNAPLAPRGEKKRIPLDVLLD